MELKSSLFPRAVSQAFLFESILHRNTRLIPNLSECGALHDVQAIVTSQNEHEE